MHRWFIEHQAMLEGALEAIATRGHWTPFVESPSRRHHPEGAHEQGRRRFEARLHQPFALDLPAITGRTGQESSPYTGQPLGIDYPRVEVQGLYQAIARAWPAWRRASVQERTGVCLEILHRLAAQSFENAYATMHTAGQSFMMAFAGSGANSLDRGLEGLAYAYKAMRDVPERASFARRFGPGEPVRLEKRYRLVPRGVAVVISCGSYPAWNAWPAVFANLATGNPVVLKPHPGAILPMAIGVETGRQVLREAGLDPNLLTLAADTWEEPLTKELLHHPDTAIIDFTGGQRFGAWIEETFRHKLVYTETAGCNAALLESTHDLDATLRALANSLALFSSQMCTSPQNLYLPAQGVYDGARLVPVEEVTGRLVELMDQTLANPLHAAGICGALHSPHTGAQIEALRTQALQQGATVLRASAPYPHPEFSQARTATPLLLQVEAERHKTLYQQEHFGPMAFVIVARDRQHALERATSDARQLGAIASYAWTTDPAFLEEVQDAFALAGASVGCNLTRHLPLNFTAAFSDYHVTGLNPAGNACLTDLAFVTQRFRVVQSKTELPPTPAGGS